MISVISCLLFYVDFCRGITVISTKFLLEISFSPPLPPPLPPPVPTAIPIPDSRSPEGGFPEYMLWCGSC